MKAKFILFLVACAVGSGAAQAGIHLRAGSRLTWEKSVPAGVGNDLGFFLGLTEGNAWEFQGGWNAISREAGGVRERWTEWMLSPRYSFPISQNGREFGQVLLDYRHLDLRTAGPDDHHSEWGFGGGTWRYLGERTIFAVDGEWVNVPENGGVVWTSLRLNLSLQLVIF